MRNYIAQEALSYIQHSYLSIKKPIAGRLCSFYPYACLIINKGTLTCCFLVFSRLLVLIAYFSSICISLRSPTSTSILSRPQQLSQRKPILFSATYGHNEASHGIQSQIAQIRDEQTRFQIVDRREQTAAWVGREGRTWEIEIPRAWHIPGIISRKESLGV